MKIDIERIEGIVHKNVKDEKVAQKILSELQKAVDEAKEENAVREKKEKSKLVAIQLEDPTSVYVVKTKESTDVASIVDLIRTKVVVDFNTSKKGQKYPVKNLAQAFEFVASRFYKEYDLHVQTKTPIDIIKAENKLQ
jgi:hypothetical protein